MAKNNSILEDVFYDSKFYFSYSSLNKLLFSPAVFYNQYILGNKEEKLDSYLVEGKVIHALILDQSSFNKDFIVSPAKLPADNIRSIIDSVYYSDIMRSDKIEVSPLESCKDKILEKLKEIDLYQSLKTDEQRIDKVITEQTKSYWEYLSKKEGKTMIDAETLERCTQYVEKLKTNVHICELLGIGKEQSDTFKIYNEIELRMDLEKLPFGLKGILDNVVISIEEKYIMINDLKTTGKTISDFKDSVDFYNYWMQAAIYTRLVLDYFKDYIDGSWIIKFNFIVIDKHQQVYPFQVKSSTMLEWIKRLHEKLIEASYHYDNRDYNLPYQFASGKVYL